MADELSQASGFEWDEANAPKIWERHLVSQAECEQLLFNVPLVVEEDVEHSDKERRYYALGVTDQGRRLFVVFTLREGRIRVISARDMSRKERRIYQDAQEKAHS